MPLLPVVAVCAIALGIAYITYGRLISRWFGLDETRRTPAVELNDGRDYVPAPVPVVLGGHFTAIAAAGPVVGPILAALAFGWLPALLWIVLGAIFIGGVHDAGSLIASIRHRARSITEVVRQHMSRTAYVTFLLFVWISLVYIVIAFTDVTAGTFANFQIERVTRGGDSRAVVLNGGSVVAGAAAYLILSVVLGLAVRYTRIPWWCTWLACIGALIGCIWQAPQIAGWLDGQGLTFMDTRDQDAARLTRHWDQVLLMYCLVASVTPMWLLLQPRGLIGAAFLGAALFFGVAGTLIDGWSGAGTLVARWPAFRGFTDTTGAWLFPFLFITIACGACSGFHSIVSSGTTSKQVRSERDVRPIGYGAMLLEALVAVFAVACVMILTPEGAAAKPDTIYALGIGTFAAQLHVPLTFAVSFGLLAFSSFVFDTLDVCTRLGRYVLQEITGLKGFAGGALATIMTLAAPSLYLWNSPPGSFRTFWMIFGTSNQLLAALTLVGVSVWLWRTGRPVWFALVPAMFMVFTTATALVLNFQAFFAAYRIRPDRLLLTNMSIAAILFALGGLVVFEALRTWRMTRREIPRVAAEA
jgi:carbon starvation protein